MADNNSEFNFNISLSVLDHLGRNLYRSFITVIGEAISNSWDAGAENVWITINREENYFVIRDDGIGMSKEDFQGKFLNIGYSKRKDSNIQQLKGRHFIGGKGIGKLALLSCAKKISIITKTSETDYVGGVIDNNKLDQDISDGVNAQDSKLSEIDDVVFLDYKKGHTKGTIIYFEDIHEGIKNKLGYIKTLIALSFKFSLIDEEFNIFVGGKEITIEELKPLAEKTQFFWNINAISDPYLDMLEQQNSLKNKGSVDSEIGVNGFIASTEKPSGLTIRTMDEKVGVDLFVNGRLREKNILSHTPDFATRHIASYLYGQIHFDLLDDGTLTDRMTTSREGIKEGDEEYAKLIKEFKDNIFEQISKEWNEWRNEIKVIKPDITDTSLSTFSAFTESKQTAINEFLNVDEGEDLKEKAKQMIANISPAESSNKKILITHSSEDSEQANIIYELLLFCGFLPKEILYTSSNNIDSKTPEGTNTLGYIRKFFVNDWFKKPYVFFIASQNMENSWYACLEVGAFWVVENTHKIATIKPYEPKLPLNPDNHIYLTFNDKNQCDKEYLFEMFKEISEDFNKDCLDKKSFLNEFSQIISASDTEKCK
ncbi:ATP-binding protein [Candidatus Thiodubiliella endoseptemdiera]|uniref:ATP-binding protein n=1 Tax=Candidatus Thiodubiliella endoseptemdiera TaxID=2738886 RepID=UPI0034DEE65A